MTQVLPIKIDTITSNLQQFYTLVHKVIDLVLIDRICKVCKTTNGPDEFLVGHLSSFDDGF
jgi:hypothetical protein